MNFSPLAKAWIRLVSLVLGTGIAVVVTSHAGGANWIISTLLGVGTAATNVYHALADSPKDRATTPPFSSP